MAFTVMKPAEKSNSVCYKSTRESLLSPAVVVDHQHPHLAPAARKVCKHDGNQFIARLLGQNHVITSQYIQSQKIELLTSTEFFKTTTTATTSASTSATLITTNSLVSSSVCYLTWDVFICRYCIYLIKYFLLLCLCIKQYLQILQLCFKDYLQVMYVHIKQYLQSLYLYIKLYLQAPDLCSIFVN